MRADRMLFLRHIGEDRYRVRFRIGAKGRRRYGTLGTIRYAWLLPFKRLLKLYGLQLPRRPKPAPTLSPTPAPAPQA